MVPEGLIGIGPRQHFHHLGLEVRSPPDPGQFLEHCQGFFVAHAPQGFNPQGEAAKAAIIAKAEESAVRLQEQAKRTAQNEIDQAVESIRAEMAEKIALAAERMLAERLTAQEHGKLIDQYLTKVVLN